MTKVVCYKKLAQNLEMYGIRGKANNLIISYLVDREQYVNIDNVASSMSQVKRRVPQGSVLRPLVNIRTRMNNQK